MELIKKIFTYLLMIPIGICMGPVFVVIWAWVVIGILFGRNDHEAEPEIK